MRSKHINRDIGKITPHVMPLCRIIMIEILARNTDNKINVFNVLFDH